MKLLAQRGVRGENPENTLPAFQAAVDQKYDYIGITAHQTKDGFWVVCADKTVNCTARYGDGSPILASLPIGWQTLRQLRELDFGIGYHVKFRGTQIPLLEEALELCRRGGIKAMVSGPVSESLWNLLENYRDVAELALFKPEDLEAAMARFPEMALHYHFFNPGKNLPACSRVTYWTAPELAAEAKQYGPIGLYEPSDPEEAEAVGASILATNGKWKHEQNKGFLADMHVHTDHSHDAHYPMEEMVRSGIARGIGAMAIADHCDVTRCENDPNYDIYTHIKDSCAEVDALNEKYGDKIRLLRSVELGDGVWYPEQSHRVAQQLPYDVIVGATHAVRCDAAEAIPLKEKWYSQIKFPDISEEQFQELMDNYFDDMLAMVETQNIDIMAHILCGACYYVYRHKIYPDLRRYAGQMARVMNAIIEKGIAMEMHGMLFLEHEGEYPYFWVVELYRQLGGYLITISTDAHDPGEVGDGFEKRVAMLKKAGFTHILYYKDRKAVPCSL